MTILCLSGCTPVPLAHYLKALGILRLLHEQADPKVTGWWNRDVFHVSSKFDASGLIHFFLFDYCPTPVLAPWNGGSGFFPKDNHEAFDAIVSGKSERFLSYRVALAAVQDSLSALGLKGKPDPDAKLDLLKLCRNSLSEETLEWIDSVFVLGVDGAKYPPLLGTGGNDGRLEFTNNFMQQIVTLIDPETGIPSPSSEQLLRQAFFSGSAPGTLSRAPIGQFLPGAAGGANATAGFDGHSAVNFWDFVLMIEGALLFAAASVKKLESGERGQMVYPFCVRQAGVGYGSASPSDEANARCEMWMPLWERPTTLPELRAVFGEGRAQVNGRAARNGVDFTRAAVTFGVDRGLTAFQRYGFQVRNGLSYFATPLERVLVRRNSRADLLSDIDLWLERLRSKAGPQANPPAPASVTRALNRLEAGILALCKNNDRAHVQGALAALGQAEQALTHSLRWATSDAVRLRPLAGLTSRWLAEADTGSREYRLAVALASTRGSYGGETLPLRQHLEPVEVGGNKQRSWVNWLGHASNDVVWHDGDLISSLNAIFARRLLRATKAGVSGFPDWAVRPARLDDLAAFIEHRTNDNLLSDLIWSMALIDWTSVAGESSDEIVGDAVLSPSSLYALLRLCFRRSRRGEDGVPAVAAIHQRAAQGSGDVASQMAARRLRSSGYSSAISEIPAVGVVARRTAAALLFPIDPRAFHQLQKSILRQHQTTTA